MRETILAYLPDALDSRDFTALHAALGAYLALPEAVRTELERSDLNEH